MRRHATLSQGEDYVHAAEALAHARRVPAIERIAEYKSEYFNGEMFAMAGGREQNALVAGNLYAALHPQFRARPCRVYMSEMRVRVSEDGLYTYPDVTAVCGEPRFLDDGRDTLLNSNLIVEVLSKSTEAYDRGLKFEQYRKLESLSEYLLLSADRVSVELFTRQPDGRWLLTALTGMQDIVELQSVDCRIALQDVYEKVEFA